MRAEDWVIWVGRKLRGKSPRKTSERLKNTRLEKQGRRKPMKRKVDEKGRLTMETKGEKSNWARWKFLEKKEGKKEKGRNIEPEKEEGEAESEWEENGRGRTRR